MKSFQKKNFKINRIKQKQFLYKIPQYEQSIASQMRSNDYKKVNQSERTVVFTFSEISFLRSKWTNGLQIRTPVDEWLDLKKSERYSKEFLYRVAKFATMMLYRQVCKVIKSFMNIIITKDCVLKAVKLADKLVKVGNFNNG
ncbi:DDE transposase [Streptococcus pseudoporcinus]|uniref:DDE transposase n=1 Tax=Streptococcus pseudoporcinus TaxID=361101 RepID=A0A4V6KZV8_9STRE|nr:DDE transposase [Streptococcus pseudoporcinus]